MISTRMVLLFLAFLVTNSVSLTDQQTYIVHMDKTKIPTSVNSQDSTKPWSESIIDFISEASTEEEKENEILPPQLLYTYETSMFGFAAQFSEKQLKHLNKIDGFLSAIPDELSTLHTTFTPHFLGLNNGKGLWSVPNLASEVIIGVLDSGIWPEHISFKDSGMSPIPSHWKGICEQGTNFSSKNCNKKLIGARAYFKGYEKFIGKVNETIDYRSPRDSQGHGTHTASTAAGNVVKNASLFGLAKGTASGMRYTSRIAAYKVCWPSGCANSDVLAAMDQAVSDGVNVLSLSLGSIPKPFYNDSIAIASFGATQKGVFVSCSAGNSGPFASTVGNGSPWIMTVAASYTSRSFPTKVKLGNNKTFEGTSLYQGIKQTNQLPLVYAKSAGTKREAQFCTKGSLVPKLVQGKIVVCERGINSRTEKGEEVKRANGKGMILLNAESQGEELLSDPHILPATSLGASAGKIIRNYITSSKKPVASISFIGTRYGDAAPIVAAFSSRGPSIVGPDIIKPDVAAPGVNILAAWPPKSSPSLTKSDKRKVLFNIVSGTSMSCPHVSGLAALIKSVHKNWSPAAIKSALMTTAYTLNNKGTSILDIGSKNLPANPFAFGSGHVNPESASDPGLIYDISTNDYLNYLCSLNFTSSQITLLSKVKFSCPKKQVFQVGDLNYPSFAVVFNGIAKNVSVTLKRVVTNVGKRQSVYDVKVEQPNGVVVSVEPRKLKFDKLGQKLSYKVRFLSLGRAKVRGASSFGSLIWVSGKYKVRSPIAVTWQ